MLIWWYLSWYPLGSSKNSKIRNQLVIRWIWSAQSSLSWEFVLLSNLKKYYPQRHVGYHITGLPRIHIFLPPPGLSQCNSYQVSFRPLQDGMSSRTTRPGLIWKSSNVELVWRMGYVVSFDINGCIIFYQNSRGVICSFGVILVIKTFRRMFNSKPFSIYPKSGLGPPKLVWRAQHDTGRITSRYNWR